MKDDLAELGDERNARGRRNESRYSGRYKKIKRDYNIQR